MPVPNSAKAIGRRVVKVLVFMEAAVYQLLAGSIAARSDPWWVGPELQPLRIRLAQRKRPQPAIAGCKARVNEDKARCRHPRGVGPANRSWRSPPRRSVFVGHGAVDSGIAASARTRLRRMLLRIGGLDVDFIEDRYLQMIADSGVYFAGTGIRITRGRPNECHRTSRPWNETV